MTNIKNNSARTKIKQKWSTKKKVLISIAIFFAAMLLTTASAFAYQEYQVYLENTQPNSGHEDCQDINCGANIAYKPVIYLYPTQIESVNVKLNYSGKLTTTYPTYNKAIDGWQVTANPNGTLTNNVDGKEYNYLFWEGIGNSDYSNFECGFVVKGSATKDFLQSTLKKLGLKPREYNEMIVFWLPKMENNKYNLIRFAGKEYTDSARLTITPTPDSILRVFMVYKPLDKYQQIPTQQLKSFERKGFTVVEWGGTEVK